LQKITRTEPHRPILCSISIHGQDVDVVSEAKLLGLWFRAISNGIATLITFVRNSAKRLYGLRHLKRNALPAYVLISVYCTHISDLYCWICLSAVAGEYMLVCCVPQRSRGKNPKGSSTQYYISTCWQYSACLSNAK
jgi:hypothetical protein